MVSMPAAMRRGLLKAEGLKRACTSAKMGRVPSIAQVTAQPEASAPVRKRAEGSATSAMPVERISKTPISSVEPKRFFTALSRR